MTPADLAQCLATVAGSTTHKAPEFAEWAGAQAATLAAQQLGGEKGGRRARERSAVMRSAILQAAGLEPMKAGPLAGGIRAVVPLTTRKWAETVIARIESAPRHYGMEEAPSVRLAEAVLAQLRKESTAAK